MKAIERTKLRQAQAHLRKAEQVLDWYYNRTYNAESVQAELKCAEARESIDTIIARHDP